MARVGKRKINQKYTTKRSEENEKEHHVPKKITLPRLKFLEGDVPNGDRKDRKPG